MKSMKLEGGYYLMCILLFLFPGEKFALSRVFPDAFHLASIKKMLPGDDANVCKIFYQWNLIKWYLTLVP